MKLQDPSGQTWRVSRRWLPWRPRLRDVREVAGEAAWFAGDPADIAIWICIFLVSVLAPVLLALLFLPFELIALVVVLPVTLLGRVLFGRRWYVEIRRGWKPWTEVEAGDWQASSLLIHALADGVRRGEAPERTLRRADSRP